MPLVCDKLHELQKQIQLVLSLPGGVALVTEVTAVVLPGYNHDNLYFIRFL